MIKVMHVLMTNKFSGAEKVAIEIIKKLESVDIEFYYIAAQGPIEEVLCSEKIKYRLFDKVSTTSLRRAINEIRPDIIHCHDFTASLLSSIVAKNIPLISHLHHNASWMKKINIKSMLYLFSLHRYKCVLAVSQAIFDEYRFSEFIKNKIVIGNIIDIESITKKYDADVKKDIDILFLGRMCEAKNPERFIQILEKIYKDGVSFKAAIVGDGELFHEIEKKIKEMGMSNIISMYGFRKNVYEYLNRSKIGMITSKWEGFGLGAVECLAFGLPIVSSNVGGLKMLINDSCGKLCDTDEEFIEMVKKLLADNGYYEKKRENAFIQANRLNNVGKYKKKMLSIYKGMVEK